MNKKSELISQEYGLKKRGGKPKHKPQMPFLKETHFFVYY